MTPLVQRLYSFFGWEFEMDNIAFTIGSRGVYWYGILIAAGFLAALCYCYIRAPKLDVDRDKMIDAVIVGLLFGVIGGRLYFVLFDWLDGGAYNSFLDVIAIWDGGIAIYGGILFALLSAGIYCKIRKVNMWNLFDIAVIGFFIGQCVGRWGNFINQEVYGVETGSTWFGIGVQTGYNTIGPMVHPLFLYESLWCLAGFVLLHFVSKHRRFRGQLFSLYLIFYSAGRFVFEGLRNPAYILKIGPFAISQLVAIACIIAGIVLYNVLKKKTALGTAQQAEYEALYESIMEDEPAPEAAEETEAPMEADQIIPDQPEGEQE